MIIPYHVYASFSIVCATLGLITFQKPMAFLIFFGIGLALSLIHAIRNLRYNIQ